MLPILTNNLFDALTLPANVETPDTFKSSKVVCPSTSIYPDTSTLLLISTAPPRVDTPATLRSSNVVCPSTSM